MGSPQPVTDGPYGFAWGPLNVVRYAEIDGRVVLGLETDTGRRFEVYVSPTGRSLRVFEKGHGELVRAEA